MVTHENILALLVKKDMRIAELEAFAVQLQAENTALRAELDSAGKLVAELQKTSEEKQTLDDIEILRNGLHAQGMPKG